MIFVIETNLTRLSSVKNKNVVIKIIDKSADNVLIYLYLKIKVLYI